MKFVIDGTEYEAASLERVTGALALDLPRQASIGLQQLAKRLEEMARIGYAPDGSVIVVDEKAAKTPEGAALIQGEAVLDSEPHLRALLAFLWVSRRLDGDRTLTFDQACDFPITSLQIIADDEAEEDEAPDPTRPGSDPVDVDAAAVPSPTT